MSSSGSVRLRAVVLVSIAASLLALALGVAGAVGLWYRAQPADDATAQSIDSAEPSLRELAGQVLTEARDVATYVRESASRDLSTVTELLRRRNEETDDEQPARARTKQQQNIGRMAEHRPGGSRPSHAPLIKRSIASAEIVIPTVIPVPTESPVLDGRDSRVTPPSIERVRLRHASEPLSQGALDEAGLVELVVSASGVVESAKFVTNPLDVHQSMLLSAVKAWRFRPARLNGQAIRYRLRVPISRARI